MCGWLRASMSGLTRSATRARRPAARAAASIRSISPADSALIERRSSPTARASSAARLADAGEDDLAGGEAGPERGVDLAARVRVGQAAQAAEQAHEGEVGVRLERVVQRVRHVGERGVERGDPLADRVGAVDVEGRARAAPPRRRAASRRTAARRGDSGSRSRQARVLGRSGPGRGAAPEDSAAPGAAPGAAAAGRPIVRASRGRIQGGAAVPDGRARLEGRKGVCYDADRSRRPARDACPLTPPPRRRPRIA